MDIHQNARTTPHGRTLMVRRLAEGWTSAAVAAAFGVDAQDRAQVARRHAAEGEAGLADRSSRPHRSPTRLGDAVEAEIEALRRQRLSGPAIARRLGRPVSTVGAGAAPARPRPARRPRPQARDRPLPARAARRADPHRHQEARPDRRRRPPHHRRPAPARASAASAGSSCTSASTTPRGWPTPRSCPTSARTAPWPSSSARWPGSPRLGVTVERVMTDNGSAYRSQAFRQALARRRPQAQAHPALHAADQRQGRALHPDQPARMGLRAGLRELRRAHRRHRPWLHALQHRPAARGPRRKSSRHPPAQGQRPWKRQLGVSLPASPPPARPAACGRSSRD